MSYSDEVLSFLIEAGNLPFTASARLFPRPLMVEHLTAIKLASEAKEPVSGQAVSFAPEINAQRYASALLVCAERFEGAAEICDAILCQFLDHCSATQSIPRQARCIRGVILYSVGRLRFMLKRQQLNCGDLQLCPSVPIDLEALKSASARAVMRARSIFSKPTRSADLLQDDHLPELFRLSRTLGQPSIQQSMEIFSRQSEVGCSTDQQIVFLTVACFLTNQSFLQGYSVGNIKVPLSFLGTIRKRARIIHFASLEWRRGASPDRDYHSPSHIIALKEALRHLCQTVVSSELGPSRAHPVLLSMAYQSIIIMEDTCQLMTAAHHIRHGVKTLSEFWQDNLKDVSGEMSAWENWRIRGCNNCVNLDGVSESSHLGSMVRPCSVCKRGIFCHSLLCLNYSRHKADNCL